nr:hypothetical protein [uncultured Halomonas sp.]
MKNEYLVAFVHTPKAAGSTINKQLESIGSGYSHIENYCSRKKEFDLLVNEAKWVSGHLPYDKMQKMLDGYKNEIKYYSSIREPLSHVRSHFNWLIEIFHKGEKFYNNHPDNIKNISEEIRLSNKRKPEEIIKLLRKYNGLFLNYQSKFIKGVSEGDKKEESVMNKYEYICDENDVDIMLQKMGVNGAGKKRINVSNYHFDPSLFDTDEMKEFLRSENYEDYSLYRDVVSYKKSRNKKEDSGMQGRLLGLLKKRWKG